MAEDKMFEQSKEQRMKIESMLDEGRRDVPLFIEKGECEEIYIPVKDGEIKVYHHLPEKITTKRPIVFVPGYVAAPFTWADFHLPHHGFCEYYYIESREKKSSRMKRHRKLQLTIEQSAIDLKIVLEHLGLNKRDYILHSSSYGGGIVFQALIQKLIDPPTVVLNDPIVNWVYTKPWIAFFFAITPPFILGFFRSILANLFLARMKNEAQKRRMIAFVMENTAWKFRKGTLQNRKFDIYSEISKIDSEFFLLHGPLDKYHPRSAYYDYAKKASKGRFIFLNTADEDRELMNGVVATEFAKVTKDEGLPLSLQEFEINIDRE